MARKDAPRIIYTLIDKSSGGRLAINLASRPPTPPYAWFDGLAAMV